MGTHFADGYKTYLFDMAPDGKSIDRGSARLVNEGNGREANKLIKVGGWYYLVFLYAPWHGRLGRTDCQSAARHLDRRLAHHRAGA